MRLLRILFAVAFAVLILPYSSLGSPAENIRVADIFGDNMVLQQTMKITVWGTANPRGQVSVSLGNSTITAKIPKNGTWQVKLPPMPAGGPFTLTIAGADTIVFKNILIGEVWLCSGQSNMNMPLDQWGRVKDYVKEIQNANYPEIRLYQTNQAYALTPQNSVASTGWIACSPQSIPGFSATAYFFGRELYHELRVPIGLVHSSSGGTPIEAWMGRESLSRFPEFAGVLQELANSTPADDESMERDFKHEIKEWRKIVATEDRSLKEKYYQLPPDLTDHWSQMSLPQIWEKGGLADFDGSVWFRKKVCLPENSEADVWTLHLGPTDDIDAAWINGVFLGKYDSKNWPTMYDVPRNLLRAGENIIDVWVLDLGQNGGIWGLPEELTLISKSGKTISLAGDWFYRISTELKDFPKPPKDPRLKRRPTVLYNAIIHPLIPFTLRGIIWYQGESNIGRAAQYRILFTDMIESWRKDWDQGDLPFLYVQIANHRERQDRPAESLLAELRESQAIALSLPNTGMVVAIDNGDDAGIDVHPKNKQEIGSCLALIAFDQVYGIDTTSAGPRFSRMAIEGNRIRIFFDHADGGLITDGRNSIKGFAIAGNDREFVWAEASIEANSVILWSESVSEPVAVRYAWADNPECNLINGYGLPAFPFRTDDWPGKTVERK